MDQPNQDSTTRPPDRTLALMAALASGEASAADVTAELRREGADALDVLIELIASASRGRVEQRALQLPIPLQLFSQSEEPDRRNDDSIVHQTPRIPVLLNGTLYDPCDISRFNGTELHFIPAGGHLLAIDDRSVMNQWWRHSYLSAQAARGVGHTQVDPRDVARRRDPLHRLQAELESLYGHSGSVPRPPGEGDRNNTGGGNTGGGGGQTGSGIRPTGLGGGNSDATGAGGTEIVGGGSGGDWSQRHSDLRWVTVLFQDAGFWYSLSDYFFLTEGYYILDLSEFCRGFLNVSDWNDEISSVQLYDTDACILMEHVNWKGSSLTLTADHGDLTALGWNDRTSSLGTW